MNGILGRDVKSRLVTTLGTGAEVQELSCDPGYIAISGGSRFDDPDTWMSVIGSSPSLTDDAKWEFVIASTRPEEITLHVVCVLTP